MDTRTVPRESPWNQVSGFPVQQQVLPFTESPTCEQYEQCVTMGGAPVSFGGLCWKPSTGHRFYIYLDPDQGSIADFSHKGPFEPGMCPAAVQPCWNFHPEDDTQASRSPKSQRTQSTEDSKFQPLDWGGGNPDAYGVKQMTQMRNGARDKKANPCRSRSLIPISHESKLSLALRLPPAAPRDQGLVVLHEALAPMWQQLLDMRERKDYISTEEGRLIDNRGSSQICKWRSEGPRLPQGISSTIVHKVPEPGVSRDITGMTAVLEEQSKSPL
ncbi:hypothetical protein MJT46_013378 [Ovis ammon polii x Ovis aries]|nr:hypothetical protein MJT46_013378 [Ovis ammon polii x Ovis aries]